MRRLTPTRASLARLSSSIGMCVQTATGTSPWNLGGACLWAGLILGAPDFGRACLSKRPMSHDAPGAFSPVSHMGAALASVPSLRPRSAVLSDLDVDRVSRRSHTLERGLGHAHFRSVLKANPTGEIIERLAKAGAQFDVASRGEMELCLGRGARAQMISCGNTIKTSVDIRFGNHAGVTLFAADAAGKVEKTAKDAPGAEVHIRLLVTHSQADWPLRYAFGCREMRVPDRFARAVGLALARWGCHSMCGSQAHRAGTWTGVFDPVTEIWRDPCRSRVGIGEFGRRHPLPVSSLCAGSRGLTGGGRGKLQDRRLRLDPFPRRGSGLPPLDVIVR